MSRILQWAVRLRKSGALWLLLLLVAYPAVAEPPRTPHPDCERPSPTIPDAEKLKDLYDKLARLDQERTDAVKLEREAYQTYKNAQGRVNQLNKQVSQAIGQLQNAEGDQRPQLLDELQRLTRDRDEARRAQDEAKKRWDEAKVPLDKIKNEIRELEKQAKALLKDNKNLKDFEKNCLPRRPCVSGPGGQCR